MQTETGNIKETLAPILRVLNDLGGKFSFTDEEGNQFILASKNVFEGEQEKVQEQQLSLPQADTVSRAIRKHIDSSLQDDVLDRINRDIALAYAMKQELEEDLPTGQAGLPAELVGVMEDLAAITEGEGEMIDADPTSLEELRGAGDVQQAFSSNANIPVPPKIRFEPLRGDLHPDLQE